MPNGRTVVLNCCFENQTTTKPASFLKKAAKVCRNRVGCAGVFQNFGKKVVQISKSGSNTVRIGKPALHFHRDFHSSPFCNLFHYVVAVPKLAQRIAMFPQLRCQDIQYFQITGFNGWPVQLYFHLFFPFVRDNDIKF